MEVAMTEEARRAHEELLRAHEELLSEFGEEELCVELERYYEPGDGDKRWPAIRHPLVYSIGHFPPLNRHVNRALAAKRQACAEAIARGDYRQFIWLHERPWRLRAFLEVADRLSDHHYWQTLGDVWVDSEDIVQNLDEWREALTADRRRRWAMMSKPERDKLRTLKKVPILVYRGYSFESARDGFSWTLDPRKARWFAQRLIIRPDVQVPRVAVGAVDARHVIAYLDGRNESEIVVAPEYVAVFKIEEVGVL